MNTTIKYIAITVCLALGSKAILSYVYNWDLLLPILYYFIFCITLSALLFLIIALINTIRNKLELKHVSELKKNFDNGLTQLIFEMPSSNYEDFSNNKRTEIKKHLQSICAGDDKARLLLVQTILNLKESIAGNTFEAIRNLYFELGLNNNVMSEFNTDIAFKQAEAIREMAHMQIDEPKATIEKLIDCKCQIIQNEAIHYLAFFEEFIDLRYLENINHSLSAWDYMRLYQTLKYIKLKKPSYEHLLKSKNESIVLLGILLIRFFSQSDCRKSLIDCWHLNKLNPIIAFEIIETLMQLSNNEDFNFLIADYRSASSKLKCKILEFVGACGDESQISFLENELQKSSNNNAVRIQAALSIKKVSRSGEFILNQLLNEAGEVQHKIIKHSLDNTIA